MTFRAKLSLILVLEILATISIVGILAFRRSKAELETLARDLLRARTEYAYTLCEMYNDTHHHPVSELKERIQHVRIADDGYIAVLSNAEGARGTLLIHPTSEGMDVNIPEFPHIQKIIREINAAGGEDGFANFITYRQGTDARGRQGEKKIGYYKYFAPWQWILLSTGYEKDVYSATLTVRRRVIEAIVLVGVIALILINVILVRMLRPLRALIDASNRVAAGDLDVKIEIESKDEIGALAQRFEHMLANLRENTRVWQELEIARRLQKEMLPAENPQLPGVSIEAVSLPAAEVGGDFYDFIPMDEHRFALIVGDVSGKGISGAMVMSSAMSALRFALDEREHTDDILTLANRRLVRDIQSHMFVAVFLAIYDRRLNRLYYTNAGQTMPMLLQNDKVTFLPQSDADRFPIGIRPQVHFEEKSCDLQSGDLLICYTDGIVEVMNGAYEPYGFDRFQKAIIKNAHLPIRDLQAGIIADAQNYAGSKNHHDDITVVLMKIE